MTPAERRAAERRAANDAAIDPVTGLIKDGHSMRFSFMDSETARRDAPLIINTSAGDALPTPRAARVAARHTAAAAAAVAVEDAARDARIASRRAVRDAKRVTEAAIATQAVVDRIIIAEANHRPGFRFAVGDQSAAETETEKAYNDGVREMLDAWQRKAPAVVTRPAGQSGGADRVIDGTDLGRAVQAGDRSVIDAAWNALQEEIRNAWRARS